MLELGECERDVGPVGEMAYVGGIVAVEAGEEDSEDPRCSLRYTSDYYYVRYVHFKNYVTYVPIFQACAQKRFLCIK